MSKELWPITVITSRYSGTYEDGYWLAFNESYDNIPDAVYADDVTCVEFFGSRSARLIGRGSSPEDAIKDLKRRLYLESIR